MDIGFIFEKVGELFIRVLACEFTIAGITTSIGAVIVWSIVAGAIITFLRG